MNGRFLLRALIVCGASAALAGCGAGTGTPKLPVHPVVGRVTVNGRPAANAMVVFHPLAADDPRVPRPVARTGPDGTYRLMSYAPGDEAPAGEYAVTVIWPDDSLPYDECENSLPHDRLKGEYADPVRSPLRASVRPGANEIPLRTLTAGSWSLPRLRDTEGK